MNPRQITRTLNTLRAFDSPTLESALTDGLLTQAEYNDLASSPDIEVFTYRTEANGGRA